MALSFCIVDDDRGTRRMLQHIIEGSRLGEVVGMAAGGAEGTRMILEQLPDVVLMDLLMPDQDGIETISLLQSRGCGARYVMISQIENQDMVGRAYRTGIEFFIRKPINRIEVEAVLRKVSERWTVNRYLTEIRSSLAKLEGMQRALAVSEGPGIISGRPYAGEAAGGPAPMRGSVARRTVKDAVQPILMSMGMIGESGSRDIIAILEWLMEGPRAGFPPLREIYRAVAGTGGTRDSADPEREIKAIEQRLRRALTVGISHLASLGLTDYGHPKFEYYAPLYFDFAEVRQKMKDLEQGRKDGKVKVNIKKFLQVLYLEVQEQLRE
ncbi:response regulator [Paenibacillus sanfengchensis]|uniref:response regulator n=1 Tax=Paenibacillus sanfengchensis TaxID=3119819 RepID=UPI002FDF29AD